MDDRKLSRRAGTLMVLAVLVLGVACSGSASDESAGGDTGGSAGGDASSAQEPDLGVAVEDSAGGAEPGFAATSDLPAVGPSIIKTADVSVEVPSGDFQSALQDATATAGRFGGFVVSTATSGDESRTGTIVLRVPSEDFEEALASIQDLGEVKREQVSGKDVSQEFVDLEARLRNLQAQETVLLGLMKKAQTISASIRVQNSLSSIQLDIEQIQGRMNFLEDRAAMSTIAVTFTEHGAPASSKPGLLSKAWAQAVDVTGAIVYGLVVSLGFIVPLGILALFVFLAVRLTMRTLRPKLQGGTAE